MIKKRAITLVLAALFIMGVFTSSVLAVNPPPPSCTDSLHTWLMAGQHWKAGRVSMWLQGTTLRVKFYMDEGWSLGETHVYAGTVPPTKAAPGRFPYKGGGRQYWIPLSEIGAEPCQTLYIAAHAVVYNGEQEETAWADQYGIPIRPDKGWAMYVPFTPCCEPES